MFDHRGKAEEKANAESWVGIILGLLKLDLPMNKKVGVPRGIFHQYKQIEARPKILSMEMIVKSGGRYCCAQQLEWTQRL